MEDKIWTVDDVLKKLQELGSEKNREGMKHYGINVQTAFGVSPVTGRKLAKQIGKNHSLALALWKTGKHEARFIASILADIEKATPTLLEKWVKDFNSWDLVDGVCGNLFIRTPYAFDKAMEWSHREEEFVKRAGYTMMAELAVHDKNAEDKKYITFLPHIIRGAEDERNFVKKAVNWALRQIGKRNKVLHQHALKTAYKIKRLENKAARWVANDAIRELENTNKFRVR